MVCTKLFLDAEIIVEETRIVLEEDVEMQTFSPVKSILNDQFEAQYVPKETPFSKRGRRECCQL